MIVLVLVAVPFLLWIGMRARAALRRADRRIDELTADIPREPQ